MLRLVSALLIVGSLVAGSLAAATAYLAPLSLPDELLVGKHINGPAGLVISESGEREPYATAGEEITPEMLTALRQQTRANGQPIKRIPIKEFELATWSEKWFFFASILGLIASAVLTRVARSKADASEDAPTESDVGSPESTIRSMQSVVTSLTTDLPSQPTEHAKNELILERVGALQRDLVSAFADARPQIQRRLGIAGYAQVMDRFAAAERQLNRAWSAAADEVTHEAEACLANAGPLLDETLTRLRA